MPNVVFRCDGSHGLGFGHVMRCLALADAFCRQGQNKASLIFAMKENSTAVSLVREQGYPVEVLSLDGNPGQEGSLSHLCGRVHTNIVVLDIRQNLSRGEIQSIRSRGVLVVSIDDPTERRLDADLVFYPPIPQVRDMDWTGFTGRRYEGWEWVVLRSQFSHSQPFVQPETPVVLVTMGGSDPGRLTEKAIAGLCLVKEKFEAIIILGPGFQGESALKHRLGRMMRPYTIHRNVTKIWEIMRSVDLGIAAFGGTAYELASVPVPTILLGLTGDHVKSASALVEAGLAICLGEHIHVKASQIASAVSGLLRNPTRLLAMRTRAQGRIDGRGGERIVGTILNHWNNWDGSCQTLATS